MVLRLNAFDSHLPFRFRTEMRQLSRKQHRMEKKPKNAEDEDGNDSDGGSSTATDSPGLSSFIRRKPSGRLKFNIVAFKPQGMDKTMSSKNTTVKFSKSNPRQKSFRTLRRSKSMKAKRNASTMSALGVSAGASSLFGVGEGQSTLDMAFENRKNKPSLRLTKSILLKSVTEASMIEPVERHLPNVHGKDKFSHFSQDRVITSFGGGLNFKNYKPL